jgi:hypothetical protein
MRSTTERSQRSKRFQQLKKQEIPAVKEAKDPSFFLYSICNRNPPYCSLLFYISYFYPLGREGRGKGKGEEMNRRDE